MLGEVVSRTARAVLRREHAHLNRTSEGKPNTGSMLDSSQRLVSGSAGYPADSREAGATRHAPARQRLMSDRSSPALLGSSASWHLDTLPSFAPPAGRTLLQVRPSPLPNWVEASGPEPCSSRTKSRKARSRVTLATMEAAEVEESTGELCHRILCGGCEAEERGMRSGLVCTRRCTGA